MTTVWQEALERLSGNDILQLGMDADAVRARLWPERVVTYTVGHVLAVGGAAAPLGEAEGAAARGARGWVLRAAPGATLASVVSAMESLAARFPGVPLTGFSPEEVVALSSGGSAEEALKRLQRAGLSVLGPGANPKTARLDSETWASIHSQAHRLGLPSTAVIPLGSDETPEQWVAKLELVAALQAETHGLFACEPRIERRERALDEVTGARYLQFLALCRLYLPDVPHIQADWSVLGPKVLQLALRFGADDAGLVLATPRDPHLPSHHSGEEELRRIIRDAGYSPVERDAVYGRQFVS